MRKLFKKKILQILFVVCLINTSINYSAVVSDNDGSAFITKAEFDSLKNNFQSQIDQYNNGIDSKIDEAIASYLAGVSITTTTNLSNYYATIVNGKTVKWSSSTTYSDTSTKPYFEYIRDLSAIFLKGYMNWTGYRDAIACDNLPTIATTSNIGMVTQMSKLDQSLRQEFKVAGMATLGVTSLTDTSSWTIPNRGDMHLSIIGSVSMKKPFVEGLNYANLENVDVSTYYLTNTNYARHFIYFYQLTTNYTNNNSYVFAPLSTANTYFFVPDSTETISANVKTQNECPIVYYKDYPHGTLTSNFYASNLRFNSSTGWQTISVPQLVFSVGENYWRTIDQDNCKIPWLHNTKVQNQLIYNDVYSASTQKAQINCGVPITKVTAEGKVHIALTPAANGVVKLYSSSTALANLGKSTLSSVISKNVVAGTEVNIEMTNCKKGDYIWFCYLPTDTANPASVSIRTIYVQSN